MSNRLRVFDLFFKDSEFSAADSMWDEVGADSLAPGVDYLVTAYALKTSSEFALGQLSDLYENKDSGFETFYDYHERYDHYSIIMQYSDKIIDQHIAVDDEEINLLKSNALNVIGFDA